MTIELRLVREVQVVYFLSELHDRGPSLPKLPVGDTTSFIITSGRARVSHEERGTSVAQGRRYAHVSFQSPRRVARVSPPGSERSIGRRRGPLESRLTFARGLLGARASPMARPPRALADPPS
jgi:hypothetical protein